MKRNVVSIHEKSTIGEAAAVFVKEHLGLFPVVNHDNRLVDTIGLRDLRRRLNLIVQASHVDANFALLGC
jgi:predicted transcriptional regulator